DDAAIFLLRELADFVICLFASWSMSRIEGRTVGDYGLPWRSAFGRYFWLGAALGIVSLTALVGTMRVFGAAHFCGVELRGVNVAKWAIAYALVMALVALREDFRARGYGLFALSRIVTFWPAAILSTAFFSYSHHGNSGEDWIGLANAGLYGLLACFLLRRTGNLWFPIGLHAAWDWGETYLYGVPNSGTVLPGHLLCTQLSGVPWLSGGTVGPEGSVLCTLVLAVAWVACARWVVRPADLRNPPS
ncbi:MAG TPA: CPBP family intramembrane glutamic endopeptidase, partial [Steroidobacteraceae bacterium]